MSDRRLTPANARIAHSSLRGQLEAPRFTAGTPARVTAPLTDLCAAPDGPRDRQLLMGAPVTVLERRAGWAFVMAGDDGYCGYVATHALGPGPAPTHIVTQRQSHLYRAPDLKSPEIAALSMGARLSLSAMENGFGACAGGFIPAQHITPIDTPAADPVAIAESLIGTPYLWGGNSAMGIDCSGLVQLSWRMAGRPAAGDSDLQAASLGTPLPDTAPLQRGDLIFWKGHVAILTGPDQIIHANGHTMSVAYEDLSAAIARIRTASGPTGSGAPTLRRRDAR